VKYIRVVVYLYLFLICGFILSSGIVCAQPDQNSSVFTIKLNKGQPIELAANTTLVVKHYTTIIRVEKNKGLPIELAANTTGDLTKQLLNFTVNKQPNHGHVFPTSITGYNQTRIEYTPNHNYNGTDSLTYKVTTAPPDGEHNSTGYVYLTVNATAFIFPHTPQYRAAVAFAISFIIDFIIFLAAYLIIRELRRTQRMKFNVTLKFWDIVRDENWYPSLAIFQFLLWTGIVIFAYLGIGLTRFLSGVEVPNNIPSNLVIVMGISAGSTITSSVISRFQYGGTTPTDVAPTKEIPSDEIRKKLAPFKTMLMENGKITLPRFQMFAWTWVGIIAYLGLLFLEVNGNYFNLQLVSVPDLPYLFISLMGLSQVTYLTAKGVKTAYVSINEVKPRRQRQEVNKELNNLIILGSNFGSKGTVWVEYYPPVTGEEKNRYCIKKGKKPMDEESLKVYEKQWAEEFRYHRSRVREQFDITPVTANWDDNRIVVNLSTIKDKLIHQKYVVRVEKDGLLTYANSDAAFEIFSVDGLPFVELFFDGVRYDGSTKVPIYSSITVKFDEPTQISTFILCDSKNQDVLGITKLDGPTPSFFGLKPGTKLNPDRLVESIELEPENNLSYNTQYTAKITSNGTDEIDPFEKKWPFKTEQSFTPNPVTSITPVTSTKQT
jgi:hypothetical protein